MGTLLAKTPHDPTDPIEQLCGGNRRALTTYSERHRKPFRRLVDPRLHPLPRARLRASAVVQDSFLDVAHEHNEPPWFITRCSRWLDTGEESRQAWAPWGSRVNHRTQI
jgi:hypothetical protein